MGSLKRAVPFAMKDLTLNASLTACYRGGEIDFMGRKSFNTKFFRKNIGFGITNIDIEINTSLMPSISITFKDLYGNTLFGSQRGIDDSLDSSVLFAWPPPKFIFSFKGFLGRKVTWLLSLKTTNVNYSPSDGSYEITCDFVPNQWGFFADIPFLYLIATKKLRTDRYKDSVNDNFVNGECIQGTDSIFSYIRIGKQVEVKTKEITKEFDTLTNQLSAIKTNSAHGLFVSKILTLGNVIKGKINGYEVLEFQDLVFDKNLMLPAEAEGHIRNSSTISRLSLFLLLNLKKSTGTTLEPASTYIIQKNRPTDFTKFLKLDNQELVRYKEGRKFIDAIITSNIEKINDEILARTYNAAKTQIAKLTIGRVLNQIAKDTAFILGLILEYGIKGYNENKSIRDETKSLIGKNFPLVINEDKEETPALKDVAKADCGVEDNEMAFVHEFIEAISQGIAENLIDKESVGSEDNLKVRINNAEILQGNPYKSFYGNIVDNLLTRSGIISYLTRSDDPNLPGDYKNLLLDRDTIDEVVSLANSDVEKNLTHSILGRLSITDVKKIRNFCKLWTTIFTERGEMATSDGNRDYAKPFSAMNVNVSDRILDTPVVVDEFYNEEIADLNASSSMTLESYLDLFRLAKISAKQDDDVETLTPREVFLSFKRPPLSAQTYENRSYLTNIEYLDIDLDNNAQGTYTGYVLKNNGVFYEYPDENQNEYCYIMFDGGNVADLKGKNSSNTDGSEPSPTDDTDEPLGIVYLDDEKVDASFIKEINSVISNKLASNYNKMTIPPISPEGDYTARWPSTKFVKSSTYPNGIPLVNLAYTVWSHQIDEDFSDIVWGLFADSIEDGDTRGRNQRASLRKMCSYILSALDDIEIKKTKIVGDVSGKATEYVNIIYKQMHTIFNQWETIAGTDPTDPCGRATNGDGLALRLEEQYGGCTSHVNKDNKSVTTLVDGSPSDTVFIYDYPLAAVTDIVYDIKNSVISIEPLYDVGSKETSLNLIQQICTKNNFMFIPFPGDSLADNITDVFTPYPTIENTDIQNHFHVMFTPTPESRSKIGDDFETMGDHLESMKSTMQTDAILFEFGSIDNQIVKNLSVGTDSTKPTAESILNLQRLVDKENTNHGVKVDCSMLPVLEGRSYVAKLDILGNSQIYPMQYFFIDKNPLFGGLYQIMKVNHNITPNNMTTSLEGIRMRFSPDGNAFGGIKPITLETIGQGRNMDSNTDTEGWGAPAETKADADAAHKAAEEAAATKKRAKQSSTEAQATGEKPETDIWVNFYDGDEYLIEETRGIRNNNPGNIRISDAGWKEVIPENKNTDGSFEQFTTFSYGIRALIKLLHTYYFTKKLQTVQDIISTYAPATENDTTGYIEHVADGMGVVKTEKFPWNPKNVKAIVKAIIKSENGAQYDITDAKYAKGSALVDPSVLTG